MSGRTSLAEIEAALAGRGVAVSSTSIWRLFGRRGRTLKKSAHANEQSRSDVLKRIRTGSTASSTSIWQARCSRRDSPDCYPIENAFSKLKAMLRKAAARTRDQLWKAIAQIIDTFTPKECANYFAAAGYDAD